jgi:hypothetical protein
MVKRNKKLDNQALMDYFFFDEADLSANRSGKLSEKQAEKLTKAEKEAKGTIYIISLFLLVITLVYPFIALVIPMAQAALQGRVYSTVGVDLFTPGIWVLCWGIIFTLSLIGVFNNAGSLKKIQFKQVVGPLRFVVVGGGRGSAVEYEIHVGKVKLDVVSDDCTQLLTKGDTYAVYYYFFKDGTGNHILSLEWVAAPQTRQAPAALPA